MAEEPASPISDPTLEKWYAYDGRTYAAKFVNSRAASEFDSLRRCVNAVITQWNRIVDLEQEDLDEASLPDQAMDEFLKRQDRISIEEHFYLISWECVRRHFEAFNSEQRDRDIAYVWKEVRKVASKAKLARDFYEHLDQRTSQSRGRSYSREGDMRVAYFERGQTHPQHWATLGKREVLSLAEAFERTRQILQRRPIPSHG